MIQYVFSKYIRKEHFPGDEVRSQAEFEDLLAGTVELRTTRLAPARGVR